MRIIRNRFLTKIIGDDIELQLPTYKFDDIVGVIDGKLPEPKEILENDILETELILNDKRMNLSELYEFSDMSASLFKSSIYHASSKFETAVALPSEAIISLYIVLFKIISLHKGNSSGKDLSKDLLYICTRITPRDYNIAPHDDKATQKLKLRAPDNLTYSMDSNEGNVVIEMKKFSDTFLRLIVDNIYSMFGHVMHQIRLIHDNTLVQLPIISKAEIHTILQNEISEFVVKGGIVADFTVLKIHLINEILFKTNVWKNFSSGLLLITKDGQEELVDITDLMTEGFHLQQKKNLKSSMLIKRFNERIMKS